MTTRTYLIARAGFWMAAIVIIGLYLYTISAAVGNWIGMSNIAELLADGLSIRGIIWLVVGVAIPVLALTISLLVARGKSRTQTLMILLLGLTIVAVLQLDLVHMVPTTRYLE